jgi:hypothetical protein
MDALSTCYCSGHGTCSDSSDSQSTRIHSKPLLAPIQAAPNWPFVTLVMPRQGTVFDLKEDKNARSLRIYDPRS